MIFVQPSCKNFKEYNIFAYAFWKKFKTINLILEYKM